MYVSTLSVPSNVLLRFLLSDFLPRGGSTAAMIYLMQVPLTHPIIKPYQFNGSTQPITYPVNTPHQLTPIITPYRLTLSTHLIETH